MITLEWDEFYNSYWFESASLYSRRCLWPRWCQHTGESLWLKPCVKGVTDYHTKYGSYRRDVRWISEKLFFVQRLKYKGR
jgi:hypothetical protein